MMTRSIIAVLITVLVSGHSLPSALAASQPDVNFKIYSPAQPAAEPQGQAPAAAGSDAGAGSESAKTPALGGAETPQLDSSLSTPPAADANPAGATDGAAAAPAAADGAAAAPAADANAATAGTDAAKAPADGAKPEAGSGEQPKKVLQGYIRVVPSGTKIPIIMDTAVDSDTSQEGDEFSARTAEDLTIDGGVVVPAGSVIKGRIAQLNAPKRLDRSGSVALKFDTVTTPDNRQIPLVANIVAHGGVVHAKRGMKDIAIETGMVTLPVAAGLGIGLLAGNASKSSSIKGAGGAVIGAAVGAAVGVVILLAKKGKRVDVRPGDEMKIELAEDLRMPM